MPGAEDAYDEYCERINNGEATYCKNCQNDSDGKCMFKFCNKELNCIHFVKKEE